MQMLFTLSSASLSALLFFAIFVFASASYDRAPFATLNSFRWCTSSTLSHSLIEHTIASQLTRGAHTHFMIPPSPSRGILFISTLRPHRRFIMLSWAVSTASDMFLSLICIAAHTAGLLAVASFCVFHHLALSSADRDRYAVAFSFECVLPLLKARVMRFSHIPVFRI